MRNRFPISSGSQGYPIPANLIRWGIRTDPHCHWCDGYTNLCPILSGCQVALQKGWYTYRHNLVLQSIAEAVSDPVIPINKAIGINFLYRGRKPAMCIARSVPRKWDIWVDSQL